MQLTQFLAQLLEQKWRLVLFFFVGALLGAGYYFIQKPKYIATTTFILEEKSGMGGLAGLASQFGFNVGGLGSGGNLFAGDNILNILESKTVLYKVLLSPAAENPATRGLTLADLYLDFSGKKRKWKNKARLANINYSNIGTDLTPLQDSVLAVAYEDITKKYLVTERTSKQGSIIKVQVTASNSLFSRLMVERIVSEAANLYLDIKTGNAEANVRQMQRRSDSLLYLLNRKSYTAAATQAVDINPALKTAVVPGEIATRDKTVLATLYAEVTKNLEASKLLLSQQTPVIQLLDMPGKLLDDHVKSLPFLAVVFGAIAVMIFVAGVFIIYISKRMDS